MIKANKPFPLEGAENLRELGGYKTLDGKTTRKKVYLRSDRTNELSKSDVDFLLDYGVSLVVDLRSTTEVKNTPSKLANIDKVRYENISMLDSMATFTEKHQMPKSLFEVYKNLLDNNQEDFRDIFKMFLENDGVSLFNCSAGKDRTGILSYLILSLANVPEETILIDFEVSEVNLVKFIANQEKVAKSFGNIEIPAFFFESKRKDLKATMDYMKKKYINTRNYLLDAGLTEEDLDKLNEKFVEE